MEISNELITTMVYIYIYLDNKGNTLSFKEQTIVTETSLKESFQSEAEHEDYVEGLLKKANKLYIENEIIYLKTENEKIHQLLKEIVPTDEIKKRTFNILTEVLCKNCERVFSLYEELRVKSNEGVK